MTFGDVQESVSKKLPERIQAQSARDTAADAGLVSCSGVSQLPVTCTPVRRPDPQHINKAEDD